jgi:sugar/nucleoside kinase (ribokinase family)
VQPVVMCAGILIADLFVPPMSALPAAGELLTTEDFAVDAGGCAANTAACLAKLGVSAAVAGCVGNDVFGAFIRSQLRDRGVDTRALKTSSTHATSKTVILPVIDEDRRYVHTIGANADFTAEDLERSLLTDTTVLYVGGYLILPGMKGADLARVMRSARDRGIRTVLDIAVPGSTPAPSLDTLAPVLPHVDVFMPNLDEAAALSAEDDPGRQARIFLEMGCPTVVITCGADGALLMTDSDTITGPAARMTVVDGSGAGDAFAAGFIVGLIEGWDLADALSFASVVGASACTQLGCTAGVFTRRQATTYLQENPLPLRASQC